MHALQTRTSKLFSWSAVFFINVPFVVLGLWFSFKLKQDTLKNEKQKFDIIGAVLSFAFLASLIAGVNISKQIGWSFAWIFLAASLFFFIAFIYREKKCAFPVLQLSIFRLRNFWLASLGFFIFFTVNVGSRFLRPFYFEEGRGLDSEISGLLMVISPAIMVLLSPFTAHFQRIFGAKNIVIAGNLFLFISMILFSFWNAESSLQFIVFSMLILGVAMGLFYPAATSVGMQSLPHENYGMGSAVIASAKSMGKLVGVLVFAMMFSSFLQNYNLNIEIASIPDKILAIQYVFRFAAGLSFVGLLFSFLFKEEI